MKIGFTKFLEKKFGGEFKEKRENMIRTAELKVKEKDEETLEIQKEQKNLLKDLVKKHNIIYINDEVCNSEKYKCDNIILEDGKQTKCNKEFNAVDSLFFSKVPPMLSRDLKDEKDILNWISERPIVKCTVCSCGRRYSLSNRKG